MVRVVPVVPRMGLEPIWISPFDFKSNAYTNSATRANKFGGAVLPLGNQGAEHDEESLLSFVVEAPTGIEPVYKVLQTSA